MDITLQQVSYAYAKDTPFEKRALFDVDLDIPFRFVSSDYWAYRFREINDFTTF